MENNDTHNCKIITTEENIQFWNNSLTHFNRKKDLYDDNSTINNKSDKKKHKD